MGFALESGYTPVTIDEIISFFRVGINAQFNTSYTVDSFIGTNHYKWFYPIAQRVSEGEIKTSEIFTKLQNYFRITNEKMARPNTTGPGIIDYFAERGFSISVKPMIEAEAGELRVAVNLDDGADDYAEKKTEFCNILKTCVVGGVVTIGDESETVVLSNDQSFDFNFNLATKIPILLKLTLTLSENNQFSVLTPEETSALLFSNINDRYRFGLNFEPQRYFSVIDAPWAASVLLEYSIDDGGNWLTAVADLEYDELYTFALADISVVEA